MRMTTAVSASNAEMTTPTSYVSHWIAQTHNAYQNQSTEFYSPLSSPSSADFRTPTDQSKTPTALISLAKTPISKPPVTTWQAQAKSRLDAAAAATHGSSSLSSININNNELQEKLHRVRALLDSKKQRLSRHLSSSSHLPDQVLSNAAVGEQQRSPPPPPPPTSILTLENIYLPRDELPSTTGYSFHSSPTVPCLMEESPSDSGISDGTKTANNDDIVDSTFKNPAVIDLSKPLCREEMLAIIQILRELWRKQYGTEIPETPVKPPAPVSTPTVSRRMGSAGGISYLSNNNKSHYHSTPALNKLSAELSDIKNKLKRFSNGRMVDEHPKQIPSENKSNEVENIRIDGDSLVFIPLGAPLTSEDLDRMQAKKDALIRRQIQRREEQLIRKNQRLTAAIDRQSDYRLYEEYIAQRRQENDRRRRAILKAHTDQKRFEADPPSSHDYYFAAARNRNRMKRKASMTSFVSFDENRSYGGSTFDLLSSASGKKSMQTPKRSTTRFDFVSASLTASTTASRSKMNRAASTCNVNEHYDSFTSLNSKATMPIMRTAKPATLFGGSLMNISTVNKNKAVQQRSFNLLEDAFDLTTQSPLSGSLSSIALSIPGESRLTQSQIHVSTKSNKQTILNALRQIVLAGPANERQRDTVAREIELSEARHFIILFRDHRLQFRAVYMYIPGTDIVEKLHGLGPNIITEMMIEKWFKYNSGGKRFTNIPIRHFSIQCDAIVIHNDFWQKKLLVHMNKLH